MRYPHRMTVTEMPDGLDAGVQVDGVWSPNTLVQPVTVYDGPADVQDKPKVLRTDPVTGIATLTADATVFLPRGTPVGQWALGLPVTVLWPDGTSADAKIVQTRRLDSTCYLEWMTAVGES